MKTYYKYMPIIFAFKGFTLILLAFLIDELLPPSMDVFIWGVLAIAVTISLYYLAVYFKKISELSNRDSLTGLYNRRFFYENLALELKKIKRSKSNLSLLFIDVDNFKAINDEYGHDIGDKVLEALAIIFINGTREVDIVNRWGGEEFAIIMPETNYNDAYNVAERLRKKVEDQPSSCYKATLSIGVATVDEYIDPDKLVSIADNVLYKAKVNGKNQVKSITLKNSVTI